MYMSAAAAGRDMMLAEAEAEAEAEVGWQGVQCLALVLSVNGEVAPGRMTRSVLRRDALETELGSGHSDQHLDSGRALF